MEKGEKGEGEAEEKGGGREEERRRVKCGSGCWIGARPLARLLEQKVRVVFDITSHNESQLHFLTEGH